MTLKAQFHHSWHDISADDWNRLMNSDSPFVAHRFFALLEDTGCVGEQSGWLPMPLSLQRDGEVVFVMPLYLRMDSQGEFVFDHAWAYAMQNAGLRYYPKLTTAVPFCPVDGPRYGVASGEDETELLQQAVLAVQQLAQKHQVSSWHILFPENVSVWQQGSGLQLRSNCKCLWSNRGYASFDDWLQSMSARKRKSIRRERRLVQKQGLRVQVQHGGDLCANDWARFYPIYQSSYHKRGMYGYLSRDFFVQLGECMPDSVVLFRVFLEDDLVAGAFCLRDSGTLYGRHWGCLQEFDCLHFEVCYYSGVEYCIEHSLRFFDAGVQGCEQKSRRGFEPKICHSLHWLSHPGLQRAVDSFLNDETRYIEQYRDELCTLLPYRDP